MERNDLANRPEVVAGVALAHKRALLNDSAREGDEKAPKGTILTVFLVIAVLVLTLGLALHFGTTPQNP